MKLYTIILLRPEPTYRIIYRPDTFSVCKIVNKNFFCEPKFPLQNYIIRYYFGENLKSNE